MAIVPYGLFTNAFLSKVTEYDFVNMTDFERNSIVDGFMKRAISSFRHICKYDFATTGDDATREFVIKVTTDDPTGVLQEQLDEEISEDLDEIVDIVSEGMLVQWLKPYVYAQESLENIMNTKDFTTYSSSGLLSSVTTAYNDARKIYTSMAREYSFTHGDLTELHL